MLPKLIRVSTEFHMWVTSEELEVIQRDSDKYFHWISDRVTVTEIKVPRGICGGADVDDKVEIVVTPEKDTLTAISVERRVKTEQVERREIPLKKDN